MGDVVLSSPDAFGLNDWFTTQYAERVKGDDCKLPCAALLTGPPAAGKTTLLSQLMALALWKKKLVPILIKVQLLQRQLLANPDTFAAAWNYVDAYHQLEYGTASPLYRYLRQVMVARRALLLIDGLDEGGQKRDEFEVHVAEVLAPQGHVMLCTSRPAGLDLEGRFGDLYPLTLKPLTNEQQQHALEQRLGKEKASKLIPYVRERVPVDIETGLKVTSNPLMLSMVASVFELRQGSNSAMPETVIELYKTSSDAMLARGNVDTQQLTELLKHIFFEAHVAQRRVIEDRQLDEAALGYGAPKELKVIRDRAFKAPLPQTTNYGGNEGEYVEVVDGKFKGKRGTITAKKDHRYTLTFAERKVSGWLEPNQILSSGLSESAVWALAMQERAGELTTACEHKLPEPMRIALHTVRARVESDELPLLSLLQANPLQLQSSHLSYQEYFAACALKEGKALSGTFPWQWSAWWANVVTLGGEMGPDFARGLLRAANVDPLGELNLSKKQLGGAGTAHGGDRTTVMRVLSLFTTVLTSLTLYLNNIGPADAKILAKALASSKSVMTFLDISGNPDIHDAGMRMIGDALLENSASKLSALKCDAFNVRINDAKLEFGCPAGQTTRTEVIGPAAATLLAGVIKSNSSVTKLLLGNNKLRDEGATVLCDAIRESTLSRVQVLDLHGNGIGPDGAKAIAALYAASSSLSEVRVFNNLLGDEGATLLCDALRERPSAVHGSFDFRSNSIGPVGAKAIAALCAINDSMNKLLLSDNKLQDEGATVLCDALRKSTISRVQMLDLYRNGIGAKAEGAKATAEGAKAIAALCAVNSSLCEVR